MIKNKSILFPCSFCGKVEGDCEIIIVGPTVNICNECVEAAKAAVIQIRQKRSFDNDKFPSINDVKDLEDAMCIDILNSITEKQ